jgi:hypothetical protein
MNIRKSTDHRPGDSLPMASTPDVANHPVRSAAHGVEPDSFNGILEKVQADLDSLRVLNPNWDGYGAPAIDPAIIEAARSFLATLPLGSIPRPQVVPLSNGALQLEWHAGPKSLELEFETPASIRYLQWDSQAILENEDCFAPEDVSKAMTLIDWFVAGRDR